MASSGKQLPECRYGSVCYRTNGNHRLEYWHPENVSQTRTDVSEDHSLDTGAKDGGKNAVCFHPSQLFARNSTFIKVLVECAARAGRGPDALKGLETGQINEFVPKHTTLKDAPPNVSASAKKPDARILLLLIGVPGSGKSTFCAKLISRAAQPWTRICQDIIAKGKRGTKKECLKQAECALAQNRNVVIDRCNINNAQRLEFLQLATKLGIEAHGVVLNLPASVCIQRASERVEHEGGVDVRNAGSVINHFVSIRKLPSLSEGFFRITFCRTDTDVEKLIQQYGDLLPAQHLESGIFGAPLSNGKNALHLVPRKGTNQPHKKDEQVEISREAPQQAQAVGRGNIEKMKEARPSCRSEASNTGDLATSSVDTEDMGPSTLAFPSISTSDFQFDHEKAATVLVEAVAKFLRTEEDSKMRLVLVDLTYSHMLSLVSRMTRERGLDSNRFLTFVGDITKLRSSHGPACNIIANAANWRLKAGGGGVNAAIYSAAGPGLEDATKKVAETLNPGTSVVVQLPESSPLHSHEGVTHVIHVLGPNMNPQRPNCLSGNYFEGCKILQSSYASLFQNFSSVVRSRLGVEAGGSKVEASRTVDGSSKKKASEPPAAVAIRDIYQQPVKNAFTVLMQASKRYRESNDGNPKRDKVRVTEEVVARAGRGTENTIHPSKPDVSNSCAHEKSSLQNQPHSSPRETSMGGVSHPAAAQKEETCIPKKAGLTDANGNQQRDNDKEKRWDGWALALHKIAMHPEQHADVVLQITDDAIVLRDRYPKAKQHFLVVAKRPGLDSLDSVQKEHLPLLRHMHSLGEEWAASSLKEDPSLSFRLGYHLAPSMRQVHLHVISQDFDSASLKNKKHWNSFTTPFFRDSSDVLEELDGLGKVQICVKHAESFLDSQLRCHRCRSAHPNLPRLKQHISTCTQPFANQSFIVTSKSLAL